MGYLITHLAAILVNTGLAILAGLFLLHKFKNSKKAIKFYVLFYCIYSAFCFYITPFENSFLHFSSPKSAFEYVSFFRKYELVTSGDLSAALCNDNITLLSRNKVGWHSESPYQSKSVSNSYSDDFSVIMRPINEQNEMFVGVITHNDKPTITDPYNTVFIQGEPYGMNGTYFFGAWIKDVKAGYYVTVNGVRADVLLPM